jgi:hypothetical protein
MAAFKLGSKRGNTDGTNTDDGINFNSVGVSVQRNQRHRFADAQRMGSGANGSLLKLVTALSYLAIAAVCTTIDPAGCRPHADESPFDHGYHIVIGTDTHNFSDDLSSCTWCGKNPEVH